MFSLFPVCQGLPNLQVYFLKQPCMGGEINFLIYINTF